MSAPYPNTVVPAYGNPNSSGNYMNRPTVQQQQLQKEMNLNQPQHASNVSTFMPPNKMTQNTGVNNQMVEQIQSQQQSEQLFTSNTNSYIPINKTVPQKVIHVGLNQQNCGHMQAHLPPLVRQNITNGGSSENSSRTASPALNNTFNNQQQNFPPYPPLKSVQSTPMQDTINLKNLSTSIQNLSNNDGPPKLNGSSLSVNVNSPDNQPKQQSSVNCQPYNFKTSAINTMLDNKSQINNQNYQNCEIKQHLQQPLSNQMPPRPGLENGHQFPAIRNAFGTTVTNGPPKMQPTLVALSQNANNITTQQPVVLQQNFKLKVVNNNNSSPLAPNQLQSREMSQQQQQQQSPPPSLSVKKPMYPSQHTQTQAYLQAYQTGQKPSLAQQQQPLTQQQYQQQPVVNCQQYQQQQQTVAPPISITQKGFNHLWGQDTFDLMQHRHILTPNTIQTPRIILNNQFHESVNVNPDIMRCTLNKIPENNALLQKTRLPLGILIHPFRDINSLPVIQCPNIVRCRLCRTYINPFVYFVDSKMWKCNLCYRVNELPEDFQYDPATKTYGDVTRRPEVRSSTIEFIAPSEYMLRPPQPAIYLFLFDVSILAQQSGYLETACNVVSKHLEDMPGDARTQVGFIAYNSAIHFYNIAEGYNQPHEMTLIDIDDPFLPCPDNLLVNLKECKELIKDLLNQLPHRFAESHDPGSCMGSALQVAFKLMMASGGRVTVFQTCLPNTGAGALLPREDPNNRSSKDVAHLNPATDFYKRHALECSGYQIAVDLFVLNQQYIDLATISGVSKHCGGSVHHFPLYQKTRSHQADLFKQCLKRYLTRKIGFEAVMRIRCTRGLQVHTFHGNFFVRSTDLLSLPNVNPDAGYGMQISYEENLADVKTICFQAALLYTNSEGERRIRVHTLCLPVTSNLSETLHSADAQAIVGLLSKMAVDRSLASNLSDAREAFINATIDILSAYKLAQNFPAGTTGQLMAPKNLTLLPLYILALLKHTAFRVGTSTRLDDRVAAMDAMKTLPLDQFMKYIYPEFYLIDCLFYNIPENPDEDDNLPDPSYLQLTAEYLDSRSMFLIDSGLLIIIYVGLNVPVKILESVLGVQSTAEIPDICYGLPAINSSENDALKSFINHLNEDKPYLPTIQIIRDTSTSKSMFIEKLIDDRSESSLSYYEFLQHLRTQVK